jgi:serine/threonine-protein kinase RsbT
MEKKVVIQIHIEDDIIFARKMVRKLGESVNLTQVNLARVITSVSELSRNIYQFAGKGFIELEIIREQSKTGIRITANDDGPGIEDIKQASKKGYSSIGTLGAGIPGVQNMMDEFTIKSSPGDGTKVTAVKWQLK